MDGTFRNLARVCARAATLLFALLLVGVPIAANAASAASLLGYRALTAQTIAPGVVHEVYQRFLPNEAVHVARVGVDAPYVLRSVPASVFMHDRRETTSSICKRTKCLVGINGDFWAGSGVLGALVHHGELLRTPTGAHYQLVVGPDGHPVAGPITWHARIITSDQKSLDINGVNVPRGKNQIVLYTGAFARTTKTSNTGAEVVFSILKRNEPMLGQPNPVRVGKLFEGTGNTKINAGNIVLSGDGTGADALRRIWHGAKNGKISPDAILRLRTTPDALESIGGTPVLVRNGKPAYDDAATNFVQAQHPRTIVGWTAKGETLLVTVDGRQPGHSFGMTIPEAARMMLKLGAVDAINLDGGGSTTFVVRGKVLNKPCDRVIVSGGVKKVVEAATSHALVSNVERPVASALVLVKAPPPPAKVSVKVLAGHVVRKVPSADRAVAGAGTIEHSRPTRSKLSVPNGMTTALLVVIGALGVGAGAIKLRRRVVARR